MVRNDDFSTSALHGKHCFHNEAFFIDKTSRCGRFNHRILARYIVYCNRQFIAVTRFTNDVQVGQCRFNHDNICTFSDIEFNFSESFQAIGWIHLIRFAVTKFWRRINSTAERTIVSRCIFCCITHDGYIGITCRIKGFTDGTYTAVHHIGWSHHMCTCFRLAHRYFTK